MIDESNEICDDFFDGSTPVKIDLVGNLNVNSTEKFESFLVDSQQTFGDAGDLTECTVKLDVENPSINSKVVLDYVNSENSHKDVSFIDLTEISSPIFLTNGSECISSITYDVQETSISNSATLSINETTDFTSLNPALELSNDGLLVVDAENRIDLSSNLLAEEAAKEVERAKSFIEIDPQVSDPSATSTTVGRTVAELVHTDSQDSIPSKSSNIVDNLLDIYDVAYVNKMNIDQPNSAIIFLEQNSFCAGQQGIVDVDEAEARFLPPSVVESKSETNDVCVSAVNYYLQDEEGDSSATVDYSAPADKLIVTDPTEVIAPAQGEAVISGNNMAVDKEQLSDNRDDKIFPSLSIPADAGDQNHTIGEFLEPLSSSVFHQESLKGDNESIIEDNYALADPRQDSFSDEQGGSSATVDDSLPGDRIIVTDPAEAVAPTQDEAVIPGDNVFSEPTQFMTVSQIGGCNITKPLPDVIRDHEIFPSLSIPAVAGDQNYTIGESLEALSSSSVHQESLKGDNESIIEDNYALADPRQDSFSEGEGNSSSKEVDVTTAVEVTDSLVEGIAQSQREDNDTVSTDSTSATTDNVPCVSSKVDLGSEMANSIVVPSDIELSNKSNHLENVSSIPSVSPDDLNLTEVVDTFTCNIQPPSVDNGAQSEDQVDVAAADIIIERSTGSYCVDDSEKDNAADGGDDDDDDEWDTFQGPAQELVVSNEALAPPLPKGDEIVDDEDDWDDFEGPAQTSVANDLPAAVHLEVPSTIPVSPIAAITDATALMAETVAVDSAEFTEVRSRFSQQTIQRAREMKNGSNGSTIVTVLQRELGGCFMDEVLCLCYAALGDLTDAIFFGSSSLSEDPDPANEENSPATPFALSEELLQQDRSLSLQWSVQQLRQLVKEHNHCLPVEDTLSPKELQTVLKMHAHQHKLSRIVTPTFHHSPVGSSFRTDHFNLGKFGLHAPSSSDDAKSDPKCAQDLTSTSSDEYSKKSNNNSEVHSDVAVAQLSSAALLFLQELPDLTFLL